MNTTSANDVKREWDAAEVAIKQAEIVGFGITIAAVRELRYAGRSLLDASTNDSLDRQQTLLYEALMSCKRARLDALESLAAFLSRYQFEQVADYATLEDTSRKRLIELNRSISKIITEGRNQDILSSDDADKLQYLLSSATLIYLDDRLSSSNRKFIDKIYFNLSHITPWMGSIFVCATIVLAGSLFRSDLFNFILDALNKLIGR